MCTKAEIAPLIKIKGRPSPGFSPVPATRMSAYALLALVTMR